MLIKILDHDMQLEKEIRVFRKKVSLFRQEVGIYKRALGLRGIVAMMCNLVTGCPKRLVLRSKELRHPLWIRLRTSDAEVYEEVILDKEYDFYTGFTPRTIVDVGANCGMTSLFYANRYPDARVIAVEAEFSNYSALVSNTSAYPNVIPIHAALWRSNGQVEVFPPWPRWKGWGKWGFRVREGTGCRAVTLPTLMREVGADVIDILKIDVEGAEREIFADCDWMDRIKLLAIELHDRDTPGCSEAVGSVTTNYQKTQRGLVTFYAR